MKSKRLSACLVVFLGTVVAGSILAAGDNGGDTNAPPVNPDPQHLVWIKPGTFTMGTPTNEVDRFADEGPQTLVTMSRGFWMSKDETTQEEYLAVMGSNPSDFQGETNLPVETVSWTDATNYCGRLTVREIATGRLPVGYAYRLPTEAEWEYACRAGTTTRFGYGDDPDYAQLGEYASYDLNSDEGTHPVGVKMPNAWGLYDLHGNVWEWCLDWYSPSLPGGSVTDPRGPTAGSCRVVRGGSWGSKERTCRTAYRNNYWPDSRGSNVGFRPVLAPGP